MDISIGDPPPTHPLFHYLIAITSLIYFNKALFNEALFEYRSTFVMRWGYWFFLELIVAACVVGAEGNQKSPCSPEGGWQNNRVLVVLVVLVLTVMGKHKLSRQVGA